MRYDLNGDPIHESGWESWGFFRLGAAILGIVFLLVFGLEWAADSLSPG